MCLYQYHCIILYICLFRSCPSGSPSFWDKDRQQTSRPLKETALHCRNAQISHPDHPRTMYLLTDVDPKLLIHVDSCMYMYVKKAATWESRATLSMKSGFVGSRRSLALGASDSSTASLPFRAPGKLRDGSKKNDSNALTLSVGYIKLMCHLEHSI